MATPVTAPRSPFAVIQGTGPRPEHRSLSHWMNRVLEELDKFRSAPEKDTVHDLRVAIRRCRSLAAVMEEVDPDPAWVQMRKTARKLFRGLGEVRDAEVLEEWVQKLGAEGDPVRAQFLASLRADDKDRSESASHIAAKFDTEKWRDLEHSLRARMRLVPVGSHAAECLALERFEEARELHNQALRSERSKPWHGLRIGLKKFRYTVEEFLPDQYAAWRKNLKRLQDLLGDIHDLDVLAEKLGELPVVAESADAWHQRIHHEREERVETYRQLMLGKTSLWNEWRQTLPHGERLEAAVAARFHATARATDTHPRRTTQESRLALRIFDILRRLKAAPVFEDGATLRIMRAAAKLHGISSVEDRHLSQKGLRRFLAALALPPNWTAEQWDLMAWSVRFQRGREPEQKNGFGKLPEEKQTVVRAVAGVLRLARALRKAGIETAAGMRSEKPADAFIVQVPALADTAETAGRLAVAKHLLESVLLKPLVLKSVPRPERQGSTPTSAPVVNEPPTIAVASD
jgi:CHAD domain-containing protein